jgi:hypothetical protein
MPALTMVAVLGAAGSSQAQELRKDTKADGVLIGAGTGAAAGVVLSLATEDVCSPGVCAYLGAVAGGLIGLVIDKHAGEPRPVAPGAFVDDGLGNGALIGAVSGVGLALLDVSRRCGKGPDRVPCTRTGILIDMFATARWMALVGLVIDAAIPSRLPGPAGVPARSQRQFRVRFDVRFRPAFSPAERAQVAVGP